MTMQQGLCNVYKQPTECCHSEFILERSAAAVYEYTRATFFLALIVNLMLIVHLREDYDKEFNSNSQKEPTTRRHSEFISESMSRTCQLLECPSI